MVGQLERFGCYQEDGSLVIQNPRQVLIGVKTELATYFESQKHLASFQPIFPDGKAEELMRRILRLRKFSAQETDMVIADINSPRTPGVVFYTGDIELGYPERAYYAIFVSPTITSGQFLTTLGEEVTHGEHMANLIRPEGPSFDQYSTRFYPLTMETLGCIGRKRIAQVIGIEENSSPRQINATDPWPEVVAYRAVDWVNTRDIQLPAKELFHAPDQKRFWQIFLGVLKDPVEFKFVLEPTLTNERLIKYIQKMLTDSNAEEAIHIDFAYQEPEAITVLAATA